MDANEIFRERISPSRIPIEYKEYSEFDPNILPIPTDDDDEESSIEKFGRIAEVCMTKESIAARTGFKLTAHQSIDPVVIVKRRMTPDQLEYYELWEKAKEIPPIDWTVCKVEREVGDSRRKKNEERARALERIYKISGLTVENVNWVHRELTAIIPLICAMVKVMRAEKDLTIPNSTLSTYDLAELQTTKKLLSMLNSLKQRMTENYNRSMNISRDIHRHATARSAYLRHKQQSTVVEPTSHENAQTIPNASQLPTTLAHNSRSSGGRIHQDFTNIGRYSPYHKSGNYKK